MKSILWIVLGASAIVNAALLVGDPRAAVHVRSGSSQPPGPSGPEVSPAIVRETMAVPARLPGDLIAPGATFDSSDLSAYRDRLRAAGFPEWTVAALVGRRIDAHFATLRRQRLGLDVIDPFWKSPDPAREQERRQAMRALSRDQAAMRRDLLGSPVEPMSQFQAARLSFLSPEKVALITRLEADYAELSSDVRMEGGMRVVLDEDREKLAMIEREKRADLVAALTPAELEAYDLRLSRTAQNVRGRMANFDPTEEEFRAVYALQKAHDERFPATMGVTYRTQEEMKARSQAESELKTQIQRALGEQRYLEYERSSNYAYQAALKIVDHFKLPRENAASVYALESEFRRRQEEATRGNQDPSARGGALAALADEASTRVGVLLGAEGAKAFRESGGSWLRNLEQQAHRAAGPATPRP